MLGIGTEFVNKLTNTVPEHKSRWKQVHRSSIFMHGRLLTGSLKKVEFHANSGFSKETFIQENMYHTIISILVYLKNSRYNFTYCTNSKCSCRPKSYKRIHFGGNLRECSKIIAYVRKSCIYHNVRKN